MIFYKAEFELLTGGTEPERSERTERATAMQSKVEMFFVEHERSCHIAISNIMYRKKKALLCVASRKNVLSTDVVKEFAKSVELEVGKIEIQEITLEVYCKMLQIANRNDYIDDDDDICEKLGIADLNRNYGRRELRFSESILFDINTKRELLRKAKGLLCDSSLSTEIERIYVKTQQTSAIGHPVHYMIGSDDRDARNQILQILLTSLYQNGRIQSRRYAEINFDGNDYLPEDAVKALYKSCAGGCIVVSFSEEDTVDSEHARTGADVISGLCNIMRENRNKVLTIFCLQRKAEKVKHVFLEHLGAVTIVPITQETVFDSRAKEYLSLLAKEHGVSADRVLYKKVNNGKGYTAADLNLVFDEWYDKRLKSELYTQYAGLETANKQVAAEKPKGSAIEELGRMIGLCDAKKVINQALDFYKAQKLFQSKGFSAERPAMHMIFTGNPGTAKTTVARLFAQIMKDNDLLSVGDLYEVGRADLVGKYVGWTAPTVRAKFKAAKGSVLFNDEAYSLVDDKDGLYGDEAINTIVQEMENYREDMVVIYAGYPDKMEGFLQKNPGLRSRIAFHVPFADYNADELCQITALIADNKKLKLGDGVNDKLLPIYESAMASDDFGNGRYARNLFEKAVMKQASRLVTMDVDKVTDKDIEQLLPEDFEAPSVKSGEKRKIGFNQ
ncbi:MAG: AAA family ATPase [Bacteroidetes bacterium]|nr:AAA family ATPase [Bacteroidota bacterium]